MSNSQSIEKAYEVAKQRYAEIGVDTDKALQALKKIPVSLHCWQGDDVGGYESKGDLTGGIQATGNYPGKARTADELRADADTVMGMLPGKHRFNIHAIYLEAGGKKIERTDIEPKHFTAWIDWAKARGIGMDFNPTCFSHPKSADGFTLSHADPGIRKFWIQHCIATRKIAEHIGRALGSPCVNNVWIPDGYKDIPVDRKAPRERLKKSLDEMFAEKLDPKCMLDAVESKLFGIGSESYVVGSHEFYLGYAVANDVLLTLDAGHYHPTEVISNKLSACLLFVKEMLLHVSRPVRWDSDHVVILDDELTAIAQEIVRGGFVERVHIGLDFFDASINRIAAWTIGTRNMIKALLIALLEPIDRMRKVELDGDLTSRLAMLEELKAMPWSAVWDYYCQTCNVPVGMDWLAKVKDYEAKVLSKR